jgi:hypothetical protein
MLGMFESCAAPSLHNDPGADVHCNQLVLVPDSAHWLDAASAGACWGLCVHLAAAAITGSCKQLWHLGSSAVFLGSIACLASMRHLSQL